MTTWTEYKLGELALPGKGSIISGPFGSNISSKYFVESGIPVIRGNNLPNDLRKFHDDGFVFITKEKADELRCWATKDDLLFTAAGTIGQVGLLTGKEKFNDYVISNKQIRVRLNQNIVIPLFAYYWFSTPYMNEFIKNRNTGSTIPLINLSVVKSLPIRLPDLPTQTAIACILSSLDDKIELNNQINRELEALAQAFFKHWFIDFEFLNEDGKPYKSSGGEMVESELGEIPKGWEVTTLDKLLEVKYGKDHKSLADGNIPVYGSGGIMRFADQSIYDGHSILIPRKGTLGNLFYVSRPFWSVDTMFYTIIKEDYLRKYLYFTIKSLDLASMNVGSAVPSMTTKVLNALPIITPAKRVLTEFESLVSSFFEYSDILNDEGDQLKFLRDSLLPRLISGELEIKEVIRK